MDPLKQEKEKPKEVVRTFQSAKGMHDVLPVDEPYWDRIESVVRSLASAYGFSKIETPIMEFAELYNKTSGEESERVLDDGVEVGGGGASGGELGERRELVYQRSHRLNGR